MAQDTVPTKDPQIAALEAETAKKNAEAALAAAQLAALQAEQTLDKARSGAAAKKDELTDKKDIADAAAALATAKANAKIAQEIGIVPAGTYSGAVSLEDKSGTVEALLLASRAVNEASADLVKRLNGAAGGTGFSATSEIQVFAKTGFSNFERLTAYRLKRDLLLKAMQEARQRAANALDAVKTPGATPPAGAALPLVGAGLKALQDLLGFFKTDYEMQGVDVTLNESSVVYAVAGRLAMLDPAPKVRAPAVFEPSTVTATLVNELSGLSSVQSSLEDYTRQVTDALKTIDDAKPPRPELKSELEGAKAQLLAAGIAYQDFMTSYSTAEANGTLPLAALARELGMETALKNDAAFVLLVGLENTGGGYFKKKNLWSGLWGIPLYHMGGATLSYMLFKSGGIVVAAGVMPYHGGFVRSDAIPKHLGSGAPP